VSLSPGPYGIVTGFDCRNDVSLSPVIWAPLDATHLANPNHSQPVRSTAPTNSLVFPIFGLVMHGAHLLKMKDCLYLVLLWQRIPSNRISCRICRDPWGHRTTPSKRKVECWLLLGRSSRLPRTSDAPRCIYSLKIKGSFKSGSNH